MGEKQENDLVCRSDRDLADLSVTELQERLETSATGLSKKEAERRVDQYGYNELGEEKAYPVLNSLASKAAIASAIEPVTFSAVSHSSPLKGRTRGGTRPFSTG